MARGEQKSVTQPRPRNGNSRQHQVAELAKMRGEALELRCQGWTLKQLAEKFKRDRSTISEWLSVEMAALVTPHAEELRKLEGERLDMALKVAMETMVANAGNELGLKAIDRVIRVSARRSELFGIAAPVKLDLGNRAIDSAELELQKILEQARVETEQRQAALRAGEATSPLVDVAIPDYPPQA